jgi:hypothetical protein
MGGAIEWPGLSGSSRASCCVASVTIKIKFSHRGLHRTSKDERTVKTAHLKPVCSNGPYTAEGFRRTGTRRISSWPGETYPQNRPDTLTQTFFIHQLFPCSQTADHTFRQLRSTLQLELAQNPTSGALHARAIWRHHRTPPVDIGVSRYQASPDLVPP